MATYELPSEPAVDVLWTVEEDDALPTRWERVAVAGARSHTWRDQVGTELDWPYLVIQGVVHDKHPSLDGVAATPWRVAYADGDPELVNVRDVCVDLTGQANLELIAKAVNTYADLVNR